MARPVAYGQVFGGRAIVDIRTNSSQPFQANGGRFVFLATASRLATIASGACIADLIGWADQGTYSTSTTVGQDVVPVNVDFNAVYEMPINATQTETQLKQLVGEVCDIETVSNIQYANYDAATDKTLQIIGYKYYGSSSGEQSLLVRLYQRIQSATMVA